MTNTEYTQLKSSEKEIELQEKHNKKIIQCLVQRFRAWYIGSCNSVCLYQLMSCGCHGSVFFFFFFWNRLWVCLLTYSIEVEFLVNEIGFLHLAFRLAASSEIREEKIDITYTDLETRHKLPVLEWQKGYR